MTSCCRIVELRQYTLRHGRRDDLIALFEREFIESQEAVGMNLIGQFRDLDDPDRFVWMRGFIDMDARRDALGAFYGGPIWKRHRDAANATMLDSDNVLLLKALEPNFGFTLPARASSDARPEAGIITARLHYVEPKALESFIAFFNDSMRPAIERTGIRVLATFATESGANSFPALPVRETETVFAWFARSGESDCSVPFPREIAAPEILRQLARKPETLRLAPTARSLLR